MITSIRNYYDLAKPGIVYGNLLTAVAGFLFAEGAAQRVGYGISPHTSGIHFDFLLFIFFVVGTIFVIASACVFNNYLDRGIDQKMERTKSRALAQGSIPGLNALIYGAVLGIMGAAILFFGTNNLTAYLELFGFFSYIVVYGLAKRHSSYGVIVGSLPGAMPIVAGYAAVSGRLDIAALFLFIILVLWQMPHFYGIALYRSKEYREAGIPVLPLQKGIQRTRIEMLAYAVLFLIAVLLPTFFGFTGYVYFGVMAIAGIVWIYFSLQGFAIPTGDSEAIAKWGRKMFLYSLVVILIFSLAVSVGAILV